MLAKLISAHIIFYGTLLLSVFTFKEGYDIEFSTLPVTLGLIYAYALVSLFTNLTHFIFDNYFSPKSFLIGPVVYYFRLHHEDQLDFYRRGMVLNNWNNSQMGLMSYPLVRYLSPKTATYFYFLAFSLFFSCWITTFHKWSHLPKTKIPFYARYLQQLGILIDQQHHRIHHETFSQNHSLFGGFVDVIFDKCRVIEFFEIVIYIMTSAKAINTRLKKTVLPDGETIRLRVRNLFWQIFYNWFNSKLEKNNIIIYCMNWGFNNNAVDLELVDKLYPDSNAKLVEKFSLQLYHELVKDLDFSDKMYVDISCGKGGGVNYLNYTKNPKSATGVDFCHSNLEFCKKNLKGISFIHSDAAALPFANNQVDIFTNVEAGHCYPDLNKFYNEIKRCLNKGGYFAYTDFCTANKYQEIKKVIKSIPEFKVVKSENLTPKVLQSMESTTDEKYGLIAKYGNKFIAPILRRFTSIKSSVTYNKFEDGTYIYFYMLIRRQ